MKVTISKSDRYDYDEYDVLVTGANAQNVKEITKTTDVLLGLVVKPESEGYRDITKMDYQQLEAFKQAAAMYHAATHNAISTIKFIRTLTMTAPLKEAKQLVDYAIDASRKPAWWPVNPSPSVEGWKE